LLLLLRLMSNRGKHNAGRTKSVAGFTFLELVVVLAVIGILSAIALPVMSRALAAMRLNGAARSIANLTAAAKTKAAAQYTLARVFVDTASNSFHMETWNGTAWVVSGGTTFLPSGVTFGFGVVGTPPSGLPAPPIQPPVCTDGATPPAAIGGSACMVFNSRGIPIPQPMTLDTIYVTDGNTVVGVIVSPTGLIGVWNTPAQAAPSWTLS
jgi:prepilin-type N-terminal cleavage/methylation domain-containing protein